jgi:hypothetical protein
MVETRTLGRMLGLLGIVAFSIVMPACNSPGRPQLPWLRWPDAGSANVVQRPTYQEAERKPFRISGYAGESYGPFPAGRPVLGDSSVLAAPSPSNPSVSISNGSWEPE